MPEERVISEQRKKEYGKEWYEKNKSKLRLYHIWSSMKQRCNREAAISYKYYGAKGVKVTDEWYDYNVFREWALKNGYAEDLTLDRIDSNGDYCPENCRWTTRKVQQRNTSYNAVFTFNGETHCMREWSEITGISYDALQHRYHRNWDVERMLTTPTNKYNKKPKTEEKTV